MREEKLDPSKTVLFVLRTVPVEGWGEGFAYKVLYPRKASLSLLGQSKFIPFYWNAASVLRRVLKSKKLKTLIVCNNDNILTNHALCITKRLPGCKVIVIAEGLMNYQDILMANRAAWRNKLRPIISRLLGLRWQEPHGHLSGSYEENVDTVYSFAKEGLVAPPDKVKVIPFDRVLPKTEVDKGTVLFIETALWQWMKPEEFCEFADGFASWLRGLGAKRLIIKPHPNYPASDYLRSLLQPYEVMVDSRPIESIADQIEAQRVVGFCTTGVITLALMRPDIQCYDYGYDFYLERAYRGDKTLVNLMKAVGVTLVRFGDRKEE
jgi:hypothetical protein